MKCLNIAHKNNLYTILTGLTFLLFFALSFSATGFTLPEELTIQIKNRSVKGFYGSPNDVEHATGEYAKGKLSEKDAAEFPREGFVFHEASDMKDHFIVSAWSVKGADQEILHAAEEALTQIVRETRVAHNDEPAGYLYSGNHEARYFAAKHAKPVKKAPPVIEQKPNLIAKAELPQESLKPVQADIGPKLPTWLWYLLFVIGVTIALVLVVRLFAVVE